VGSEIPLSLDNGRSPHGYINQRLQIPFRAPDDERCRSKHVELSINFGIINSITKLHLVGISTESYAQVLTVSLLNEKSVPII
jgi:hypothetical protein